jgi:FKBP-type peptidyl-prolyl cis-trans isomerase FkpA
MMTIRRPTPAARAVSVPRAFALAFVVAAVACGDPSAPDPARVNFAPSLGINIANMTRTSSGLYYQDTTVGTGTEAAAGRRVEVLYRGWLADGTLFDEAQNPANPLRFTLGAGEVIRGWDEGVAGMRAGGVRKLVIPPALGYGNRPFGPIPANSILVFEVRLLAVLN